MIPNKYKLNRYVTEKALQDFGFIKKVGTYHYKKYLNKWVYVEIEIDLQEKWMTYFVKTKNFNEYYLPFYLEECRTNNPLYIKVVTEFNRFMDKLYIKRIVWRNSTMIHKRRNDHEP